MSFAGCELFVLNFFFKNLFDINTQLAFATHKRAKQTQPLYAQGAQLCFVLADQLDDIGLRLHHNVILAGPCYHHSAMNDSSKFNTNAAAGIVMILFAFICLGFDLLFGGGPVSFGVAVFCFLFVYGLARVRGKQ